MDLLIYILILVPVNIFGIVIAVLFMLIPDWGDARPLFAFLDLLLVLAFVSLDVFCIKAHKQFKYIQECINKIRNTNSKVFGIITMIHRNKVSEGEGYYAYYDRYTVDIDGVLYNTALYKEKSKSVFDNKTDKLRYDVGDSVSGYIDVDKLLNGKDTFLILDNEELHAGIVLELDGKVLDLEVIR